MACEVRARTEAAEAAVAAFVVGGVLSKVGGSAPGGTTGRIPGKFGSEKSDEGLEWDEIEGEGEGEVEDARVSDG